MFINCTGEYKLLRDLDVLHDGDGGLLTVQHDHLSVSSTTRMALG